MRTIRVQTGDPYDVTVGTGILNTLGEVVRQAVPQAQTAAVVTDSHVSEYWLQPALAGLRAAGLHEASFVIPAGEQSKNLTVYGQVLGFLAQENVTRSDVIVALGGGVAGDLAGFAAATYLRGMSCVQVPTSLLAMVDSSVGGKTAVDLPAGKNLAGAFCQPKAVICDISALDTLPEVNFRDGCAEVIKYGVLSEPELFEHLEQAGPEFDRPRVIAECISAKAAVVAGDEHDHGKRRMLNLGHTFGHAVEACSGFELTHGQAVAAGMAMIVRAGHRFGITERDCRDRVTACLERFGLPVGTELRAGELMPYVENDKKRRGGKIALIVPRAIGKCEILPVSVEEAEDWLRAGLEI